MRLACVRRAANVRSEPGSNSPVIKTVSCRQSNLRIDPCYPSALGRPIRPRTVGRYTLSRCDTIEGVLNVSLRFSFQGPKLAGRSGEPCLFLSRGRRILVTVLAGVNFFFSKFPQAFRSRRRTGAKEPSIAALGHAVDCCAHSPCPVCGGERKSSTWPRGVNDVARKNARHVPETRATPRLSPGPQRSSCSEDAF